MFAILRSSHRRCSVKRVFLEISQNSQENTRARFSFLIKLQAFKNTFSTEHLWTTASLLCSICRGLNPNFSWSCISIKLLIILPLISSLLFQITFNTWGKIDLKFFVEVVILLKTFIVKSDIPLILVQKCTRSAPCSMFYKKG